MLVTLRNIAGVATAVSLIVTVAISAFAGAPYSSHDGLVENSELTFGSGSGIDGDGTTINFSLIPDTVYWTMTSTQFAANSTFAPGFRNETASESNPTVMFSRNDSSTGIGGDPAGGSKSIAFILSGTLVGKYKSDGTVGALMLEDTGTKPTCDATHRGWVWMDKSGAATADTLEICAKNSSDTYAWYAMATIP